MAISYDGGENFERVQETPIMDRCSNALYIRAIHSVFLKKINGKFGILWGWQNINDINYPQYDIRYTGSMDGIIIDDHKGVSCILPNDNEYRIGRPRVIKYQDQYLMYCTYDTLDKKYAVASAISKDGISWQRDDSLFNLKTSDHGWDSQMVCYPVIFKCDKDKSYLFYSGNNMGETGVGYAVCHHQ